MLQQIRPTFLFLHRWLGLLSGLVVVILGITGAIFAFQYEAKEWSRSDLIQRETPIEDRLPLVMLMDRAEQTLDLPTLAYGLTTYRDPSRNWSVLSFQRGEPSWTYFGSIEDYRTLYLDPVSGEAVGIVDETNDLFQIIKAIHWSLLLATPIGQPIVVWSTIIFLVLLLSGLLLWWPRKWNRTGRTRSFTIQWKARFKRVVYDLHNVLGFYTLLLLFVIGFTGLFWMYPGIVKPTLQFLGDGELREPTPRLAPVEVEPEQPGKRTDPLEVAYQTSWEEFPDAYSVTLIEPHREEEPIRVVVRGDGETYYERSDLAFHPDTGAMLHARKYEELSRGEKLVAMNYDLHVGAIGGLPGKILAAIASLVAASLPITGFLLWWNGNSTSSKAFKT